MIRLDEQSGVPIYLQIVEGMRKEILNGVYTADERLPSVRDLAVDLKVNPNTVAKSYQEMETQGLIYFKRGQGAFVAAKSREERMKEAKREIGELLDRMVLVARGLGLGAEDVRALFERKMRELEGTAARKED